MKAIKMNFQDNVYHLNNVLRGLGAEDVTPLEGTLVRHTSCIGQQVGTLQEPVTTMRTIQAESMSKAVENGVSYALAKLRSYNRTVYLVLVEAEFVCSEAEALKLIEHG